MVYSTHVSDLRDQFIGRVVSNKTFAEVGGLWGTVNEKLSVAHSFNASSLTMIDLASQDQDPMDLWGKFKQRMVDLQISNYSCIDNQDICSFLPDEKTPQFDVVHCSGVLYHHPNPLLVLQSLWKITRSHLILASAVTRESIRNENGEYYIPRSAALLVPALSGQEFSVHKAHWDRVAPGYGITEKYQYSIDDFAPWWWLPTPDALVAMCEVVGFKVLDLGLGWAENALILLLEKPDDTVDSRPLSTRFPSIDAKLEEIRKQLQPEILGDHQGELCSTLTAELETLKRSLAHAHSRIKNLEEVVKKKKSVIQLLRITSNEVQQLENKIQAMESSKFWRLRQQWIQLKNFFGLPE
jgi:SAM-dependent methyltransferase